MEHRQLLIALNAADQLTRAALCRLAATVDEWHDYRGPLERAARLGVPGEQLRRALAVRDRAVEMADSELRRAAAGQCRLITRLDPAYPAALHDHPLPPPVLACRGQIPDRPAVAIVGSRRMNAYGQQAAELFGQSLAEAGLTIVSGFALGVDTTAHRAALAAESGRTVAVLGCGLDIDYPRGNRQLGDEIARRGAVISEYPMGASPLPWRFPIRNRVIAALSVATLVIQAKPRSGSLITAHQALELGRDVYAVPGSIFDALSRGTNELIADGALVARSPEDLLEGLKLGVQMKLGVQSELFPSPQAAPPVRPPEELPKGLPGKILGALADGAEVTAEELAETLDKPVDRLLGALLELELAGQVRRLPGPAYAR